MKQIYRTYADTEVLVLGTWIKCPYCGRVWLEDDVNECGQTYELKCEDDIEDGCGKEFKMHFDAD